MTVEEELPGSRLEDFVRARWGRSQGGIRGLAKAAGLSAETIYRLFNDENHPDLATLSALADALKVKRYELIAAMDGDAPTVPLNAATRESMRAELVELLPELLEDLGLRLPRRKPPAGDGGA